jgi:hypothetical protein
MIHYDLKSLPANSSSNKVEVYPSQINGRDALRIALDAKSRAGTFGIDFVDKPSFVLLPDVATHARIEVDVCARLLPDAPPYARGFIGLAYRVQPDLSAYESVYLRPANGRGYNPEPPRDQRAVQYYAYPDWPFDVLRDREPGRFEAAADIELDRWHRLAITIAGTEFAASVDGKLVLQGKGKTAPAKGRIGLWVDIGTEGYFSNLQIDLT